ncbi:hypothetical protein DFS33DRAFT_221017 [Desarmillaria ectypa]|nr:hypothetical protein DFS33DRAFT_221017 [Desarmillaria ectypa]
MHRIMLRSKSKIMIFFNVFPGNHLKRVVIIFRFLWGIARRRICTFAVQLHAFQVCKSLPGRAIGTPSSAPSHAQTFRTGVPAIIRDEWPPLVTSFSVASFAYMIVYHSIASCWHSWRASCRLYLSNSLSAVRSSTFSGFKSWDITLQEPVERLSA